LLYCACKLPRSISSSSLLLSLLSSLLSSSSSADKSTVVVAASLFVSLSLLTAITCIVYFLPSSTEDREVSLSSVVVSSFISLSLSSSLYSAFKSLTASSSSYSSDTLSGSVPFTNNSVTILSLGAFSLAKDGGLEPFWTSTSTTESGFVKSSVSVSSDRYSIVLVNNLCGT